MSSAAGPPTVTLAFDGLMLFQSEHRDMSKHVAIVASHDHELEVEIYTRSNPAVPGLDACTPVTVIKDDVSKFDTDATRIKHSPLYRKYVPELRQFGLFGEVDSYVEDANPFGGVYAYVKLPPGSLTTWSTFDDAVEMYDRDLKSRRQCFARFVVMETMYYEATCMYVGGKPYQLKPWDLVFFSNVPSEPPKHPHFPEYLNVLDYTGQVGPVHILSGGCDPTVGVGQFRDEIEDALKKHRDGERVPNGDCGPTGP